MREIQNNSKKLTIKDLVTTGIFCALYLLFLILGMVIFAPNPVLTFVSPCASALLTGPVVLLLFAKVPKHGPIIILGTVIGILLFVTGMFWGWLITLVVLGIVADLIAGAGKFKNIKLNILSNIIFALNPMGSYIFLWINREGYFSYMVGKGTEQAYVETMGAVAQPWMLWAMIGSVIVAALISAVVGKIMLKKQFEKAGITA